MEKFPRRILILFLFVCPFIAVAQTGKPIPAAHRISVYLPLLKGKNVAVFANHTSTVGNSSLVDTLVRLGIKIKVIFGPEHGFRGTADAGEHLDNYRDESTGIPVVSLYGSRRKPSAQDLEGIDCMLFDIQDVGVRFYTHISSLEEYMQSAMENGKALIVLDRPNPNGFYIDGPVLSPAYRSFVGMQPIPVVYGMSIGEYARMIKGEGWVRPKGVSKKGFLLKVIPCANYSHASVYDLPVAPSPNLPDMASIYAYPSTCFFEGTTLSEGRGTDKPFRIFGHPSLPQTLTSFIPVRKAGATQLKWKDQTCYGWEWKGTAEQIRKGTQGGLQLHWLMQAYKTFPGKDSFFIRGRNGEYFFDKLAGNDHLRKAIGQEINETAIRKTWEAPLQQFKAIRKKYLLYN